MSFVQVFYSVSYLAPMDLHRQAAYYELISKHNVGLKTLVSEGLSEPEFYGDLVYKFKKIYRN